MAGGGEGPLKIFAAKFQETVETAAELCYTENGTLALAFLLPAESLSLL